MDYTSDSDVSDGTKELVRQGLASVRRKRTSTASRPDRVYGRFPVPDTDNYNIGHPLCPDGINGAASIHGLYIVAKKIVNGQNRNTGSAEVGSEVVAELRGARTEASRRVEGSEMSNEEMLMA